MTFDIFIAGAGPSGAYLGYLLAKKGYRVAIADKEDFPRDKPCGGGISAKTLTLLDFDVTPIVQRAIGAAYLTYKNRHTILKDLGEKAGVTVLRSDFDHFILGKAVASGALFLPRHAFIGAERSRDLIRIRTASDSYTARYLMGADGVYSRVRTTLFGKNVVQYAPACEALVYVPQDALEVYRDRVLFDFGGVQNGYGWIFPKKDHLNIGTFSMFGSSSPKEDLFAFASRYETLQRIQKIKVQGYAIPVQNSTGVYQKENIWLLGDAAGFAESFFGEGIYYALKSAVIAAKVLMQDFDDTGSHRYTAAVERELLEDLRFSRLNAGAFYGVQGLGYYFLTKNEVVCQHFADTITGRLSPKGCFLKTVFGTPYWLLSRHLPRWTAQCL